MPSTRLRDPARWRVSTNYSPELSGQYARLQLERTNGRSSIARGAVLLVSIPIVAIAALLVSAGLHSIAPLLIAGAFAIIGGAAGIVSVGVGVLQERGAAKALRALDTERIPQARLLE
jgi:hypothetical protein